MSLPEQETVERVLVIVAHPDDAEFWAGGTIAAWTHAGVEVGYVVLTDGDAGGFDPMAPRSEIPAIRRAEQEAAAAVLGVEAVQFLGLAEDDLSPSVGLRRELVRAIRRARPQLVVTWSPEWNWQRFRSSHPNHRTTGEVALQAIYPDAGNRFAHPTLADDEGLDAWRVGEIWLMHSPQVNHYVDVTDTFDRKVAAVEAHRSQVANRVDLTHSLRARLAANAAAADFAEGRLAEATKGPCELVRVDHSVSGEQITGPPMLLNMSRNRRSRSLRDGWLKRSPLRPPAELGGELVVVEGTDALVPRGLVVEVVVVAQSRATLFGDDSDPQRPYEGLRGAGIGSPTNECLYRGSGRRRCQQGGRLQWPPRRWLHGIEPDSGLRHGSMDHRSPPGLPGSQDRPDRALPRCKARSRRSACTLAAPGVRTRGMDAGQRSSGPSALCLRRLELLRPDARGSMAPLSNGRLHRRYKTALSWWRDSDGDRSSKGAQATDGQSGPRSEGGRGSRSRPDCPRTSAGRGHTPGGCNRARGGPRRDGLLHSANPLPRHRTSHGARRQPASRFREPRLAPTTQLPTKM